ncbi:MAG: C4-dicarboxylate transporter DctP [Gemmatimonadaceae bacterium]
MPATIKRVIGHLNFQVVVAIVLGVLVGLFAPVAAKAMRPLGDTFVNLVKMVIAPIIFLTIVVGIANMGDLKKLGKVGGKALIYFEVVTTFALLIGIAVMDATRPGATLDVSKLNGGDVSRYTSSAQKLTFVDYLTHIVPSSFAAPFTDGDILQVVFIAILFGISLSTLGDVGRPVLELLDRVSKIFFTLVGYVMRLAPIGAFGAMAYTVGNFGLTTLLPLGRLMLDVYLTMALFIFIVLGLIARVYGFSLYHYLRFIRDEILIVLGTSSSEAALPRMMVKLERLGCSKSVVGLVIPAGYSFNLDGTSIYLSMAVLFLAQVNHVSLTLGQQLSVLAILMLTSKGAAGVTGSGFIVLASTLSAMQIVPVGSIAILLGVDRFMSEARAITNLIGNGVATIVIAKSENAFDEARYQAAVRGGPAAMPLNADG